MSDEDDDSPAAEFDRALKMFYGKDAPVKFYILDEHGDPTPAENPLEWARWQHKAECERLRVIGDDRDEGCAIPWRVSTVFLGGMQSRQRGDFMPPMFETMVFGGPLNGYRMLYHNKEQALLGHQAACGLVRKALVGK